ncbi:hypothetical protein BC628DRAFT_215088 [Trametes gibbosa]|nr:hypothetical protein BC628DRAFT_215088 [Trametes gibbosa]
MPDAHDPAQNSQYPPPQDSRPQTPSGTGAPEFIHSSDSSLAYTSPSAFYARFSTRQPSIIYHQPQLIGGRIVTPSMSSSTNSSTSNPRSASPALSTASALTSVSSAASGPGALEVILPLQPLFDRKENKKRRLYNTDRRDICLFAREHPGVKQEDIAHVFGVERSTVSKILKHKHRWLSVSINEEIQIAKMSSPSSSIALRNG